MLFSIVIATLGNKKLLFHSLKSLENQSFKDFELVIVHQGKEDLSRFLKSFNLNIAYKRITSRGLSLARNIGIIETKADYIAFLDDDAVYSPGFLAYAKSLLSQGYDGVAGLVLDMKTKNPISRSIRFLGEKPMGYKDYNLWMSSATIISKKALDDVKGYDTSLGAGRHYGSSEEADIFLRLIDKGYKLFFSSKLKAYHPSELDKLNTLSLQAIFYRGYSYGLGRGAMLRKHISGYGFFPFFELAKNLVYSLAGFILSVLGFKFLYAIRDLASFFGKLIGFLSYKKCHLDDFLAESVFIASNKMKIAQITKHYYPHKGGIETYVKSLVEKLKDKASFEIACSSKKQSVEFVNGTKIVRIKRLAKLFSTAIYPGLFFYLRNSKKDIFHLNLPDPFSVICYLLARPKASLVITWHSDIVKQKLLYKLYKPFNKMILKKADRIIVTSKNYLESSEQLKGFKHKCSVVPLGIDINSFKKTREIEKKAAAIKKRYGKKIVLFVGRLIYYKGVEVLIQAMKDVDAVLLIIGKGALEKELKAKAKGIRNIHFLGRVEDIVAYYYAADVFVLPSLHRSEAFGIVQLEAMACFKPVISTKLNTGVEFVNKDKATGFVVEPNSPEALQKAIAKLIANKALALKLGRNARKRVEKKFSLSVMAENTLKIYQDLSKKP